MNYYKPKITLVEVLIFISIIGLLGSIVWYSIKHPCVKWENQQCTKQTCTMWNYGSGDKPDACMQWVTKQDTCNVCVERK